jgi:RNA polymerase sigma-70 factor (ECF subfamily)
VNATRFRGEVLVHFEAAYNLARWLTGNDADAEDALQDATVRAHRAFAESPPRDPRAWFLQIVRNTSLTLLKRSERLEPWDDTFDQAAPTPSAEARLVDAVSAAELRSAIEALPSRFREVLVLRELEGLSYREIAAVAEVPKGTVMSRLARARAMLRAALAHSQQEVGR